MEEALAKKNMEDITAIAHKPVSYTHLDVYKRQVYDNPIIDR